MEAKVRFDKCLCSRVSLAEGLVMRNPRALAKIPSLDVNRGLPREVIDAVAIIDSRWINDAKAISIFASI